MVEFFLGGFDRAGGVDDAVVVAAQMTMPHIHTGVGEFGGVLDAFIGKWVIIHGEHISRWEILRKLREERADVAGGAVFICHPGRYRMD